jgi:uncharacterized protein
VMACGFPTRHGPAGYLETCTASKIFIQSTNDQYGPRAEMEEAFAGFAEPKRLVWVQSSDHFFAGGLDELERVVTAAVSVPS